MLGDFSIQDKIVVITGGGSGIGFAFVQQLVALKAKAVIIGDLKLTSVADDFVKAHGDTVHFTACDVTKWSDLKNLIEFSKQKCGSEVPDVWVPCAGIFEPTWSNFWHDTEDERYTTLDINVQHPIKFTRMAFRELVSRNKKGVVLHIASTSGLGGTYGVPMYCASKHAIVGLVKSLALAEAQVGIKVVGICPGLVESPLWTSNPEAISTFQYDKMKSMALTPDEIAARMADLIQKGDYAGGTLLKVEKGETTVEDEGLKNPEVISQTLALPYSLNAKELLQKDALAN